MDPIGIIAALVGGLEFFILIFISAWGVRSGVLKSQRDEWRQLAEARGEKVSDMESQIQELRQDVAEMRGQLTALQAMKADEIAGKVAALLGRPSTDDHLGSPV